MTKQEKVEAFDLIYSKAKQVNKKIKQIKKDTSLSKPINVDVLKSTKAMFYEDIVVILKSYAKE